MRISLCMFSLLRLLLTRLLLMMTKLEVDVVEPEIAQVIAQAFKLLLYSLHPGGAFDFYRDAKLAVAVLYRCLHPTESLGGYFKARPLLLLFATQTEALHFLLDTAQDSVAEKHGVGLVG